MRRDPFARGEYERVCHGPGQCAWCGQTRPRFFTLVWVRDDPPQPTKDEHRGTKNFCAFYCFTAYHS